jgi:hypothetical protein
MQKFSVVKIKPIDHFIHGLSACVKQPKGDRAFVELLMLAGHAGMDALTGACELALETGVVSGSVVGNPPTMPCFSIMSRRDPS